jgi:hypothetical protein
MPIPNLRPLLSIDDPTAPKRVVDRLVHLAKYQAVESLDNSSSKLAQAINVELLQEDRTPFEDPQNPVVNNGDIVCLRLTNKGNQPLKIAVLDIEPVWAVSQLPLDGLETPFFNLAAGAVQEVPLSMSLPDDDAYQQAREVFKVFAVQKGLADFRWLTLPPLDKPSEKRGGELDADLKGMLEEATTRGENEGVNPLNDLLRMIGADLEQPPEAIRAATMVVNPDDDWVMKQVQMTLVR